MARATSWCGSCSNPNYNNSDPDPLTTDANSSHDPTLNLTVTLGQVWQLLAVANFTQAPVYSKYIHS